MIQDTSGQDRTIDTNNTKSIKRATLLIVTLLIAYFSYYFSTKLFARTILTSQLQTAMVVKGKLTEQISIQGKIISLNTPTIYASASGYVDFTVNSGDLVQQGQIVGRIFNPDLLSELEQQQSQLKNILASQKRLEIKTQRDRLESQRVLELAQINHSNSLQELKRVKFGLKIGAVTKLEVEEMEFKSHSAKLAADFAEKDALLLNQSLEFETLSKQQEVELQQLQVQSITRKVEKLTLRAPSDGIVGKVLVQQNAAVENAVPLMTIVDRSQLAVEAEVPENYSGKISKSNSLSVASLSDALKAQIIAISPEIKNGKFTVRALLTESRKIGFMLNQSVTLTFDFSENQEVLKLAKGPFINSEHGSFLFVIDNMEAVKTKVQLGKESQTEIEIISGLNEGDLVVISDNQELAGSSRVKITNS